MKKLLYNLVLPLVLAAGVSASPQTTWYVDDDCVPPGAGTEVDPFCKIQDGVDASSDGDTVLVAPGTYTGDGNRDISLFGKLIALKSTDGPEMTILDVQGGPGSIHRGFYLTHGEGPQSVIEGLTITNGFLKGDTGGSGLNGGGGGAAIYIREGSPTVRNCVARGNISESNHELFVKDGRGGAIYIDGDSSARIEDCVLANNVAVGRGGGMQIGYNNTDVTIRNCLITGNVAPHGGGIYNVFASITITNTIIAYNTVEYSGGALTNEQGHPNLSNCILWANQSAMVGPQLFVQGSVLTIEHSTIEGGLEGIDGCCSAEVIWGLGMIDADPLFVDPENGDFRLLHGSPCIDAGNNLAVPEGVVTDLDGGPRFLDDPDTRDTGNPDPDAPRLPIVDMGPYEYDPDDCNNNDIPDAEELANGSSQDCDGDNGNGIPDECEADCNTNDQADSCDIALGVSEDCTGNAIPDECEPDCNENGEADICDIDAGFSEDCTDNGIPDECEPDCNDNGVADSCDIADQTSPDCNDNAVPDECEDEADCNSNGQLDSCDIAEGSSVDCFGPSGIPDGVPDDCCPGDVGPGANDVGPFDLAAFLASWGPCPDSCIEGIPACTCPADFNNDCTVNPFDLATLLANWGPCP